MLFRILSFIGGIGFFLILIILSWSSFQVIFSNIKYFNVIKTGKIIEIEPVSSSGTGQARTFNNKVLLDNQDEVVDGGTQEVYNVGDRVTLRYSGKIMSNIFEVNGKKISSKYDIWDWISPFLFTFCIYGIYKLTGIWISRIRNIKWT